jgi:aryl-alcohol dehydrogenase-like predicted oxidoreductase
MPRGPAHPVLLLSMQGLVRSIGISNMGVPEMTQLAATAKVMPAVNQIELHPWLQWKHVTDYCRAHDIILEVRGAVAGVVGCGCCAAVAALIPVFADCA